MRRSILILGLALIILLPRVFDLGAFMTADEKVWLANTTGFTRNLALLKWDKLLQQPHPGITATWLGSLAIHANTLAARKLPLVLGQSVLLGFIGYIFYRLWSPQGDTRRSFSEGGWGAILLTLLLALNPPLVAHTRVYAMDALLAQFLLLSLGCLLLWRQTYTARYLIYAGAAGALAVLSKLPGLIIIPFSLAYIFYAAGLPREALPAGGAKWGVWSLAFILTLIIVFPSLALNFNEVMHLTKEFLLEGDAQDVHGPVRASYYLETLLFFSTPLHLIALAALPFVWPRMKNKEHVVVLLAFAALFTGQMALGAKQGDRYILPVFLALDAFAVLVFFALSAQLKNKRIVLLTTHYSLLTLFVWQTIDVTRLHPHALAYVNPITKPLYGERRLGWGEGLDVAAEYLNQKPFASSLKVAAPFPAEFGYKFTGEVIPLNHYEAGNVDYVVLYRSLFERGQDSWEAAVLRQFAERIPEKIFQLNGLPYVWLYREDTAPGEST